MIPAKVSIGSHEYVADISKAIRRPIQSLRQSVDQGGQAGEQSLDNQAIWKRTSSDFILGQGQEFFDQEDEANRRRCYAIENFDSISNRRALTTSLSDVTAVASFTAAGSYHRLIRTPSNFWWGSGSQLHRSASLTSFTTTSITGGPGVASFRDMTTFGSNVYVAYSTAVYSGLSTGSTVTLFSNEDVDVINADLGRLVCGKTTSLFELSSTGTRIDIFTHPNASWNWTSFAGGNAGIYCAGNDGGKSEIYLITVIDSTGALAAPIPVAQLPYGELVRRIAYFGGFLIMCTSRGVRLAQAATSGLLQYGPLIALGDTRGVSFDGRFAYVTCDSISVFDNPGVIALSLDRFTAPLTPAYCAIAAFDTATAYTVWDVSNYGSYVCTLMGSAGSNIVRYSSPTVYGTGKYWSGEISFGVPIKKNVISLEVKHDSLLSGTSVTAKIYNRVNGTLYGTQTNSTVGSTEFTLVPSTEMLTETIQIYLEASGTTSNPVTIRRWTLSSVPVPTSMSEEIILPLMLSREVYGEDGTFYTLDPQTEWNYLTGIMKSRSQVSVTFGSETLTAWVDQVGSEQGWTRFDDRDRWPEGTVLIRLLTIGS
jgi:hypothetical protein